MVWSVSVVYGLLEEQILSKSRSSTCSLTSNPTSPPGLVSIVLLFPLPLLLLLPPLLLPRSSSSETPPWLLPLLTAVYLTTYSGLLLADLFMVSPPPLPAFLLTKYTLPSLHTIIDPIAIMAARKDLR